MSHGMAAPMPRAAQEEIDAAWAPIEDIITKTWNIVVMGNKEAGTFTAIDWMNVYTSICNWHVYGPGRSQNDSNIASGCDETDKEKFREKMHDLVSRLIDSGFERSKVRFGPQTLSSLLPCSLLTPLVPPLGR